VIWVRGHRCGKELLRHPERFRRHIDDVRCPSTNPGMLFTSFRASASNTLTSALSSSFSSPSATPALSWSSYLWLTSRQRVNHLRHRHSIAVFALDPPPDHRFCYSLGAPGPSPRCQGQARSRLRCDARYAAIEDFGVRISFKVRTCLLNLP